MLGAIIGDIVGSRFEMHNHKNKDFELFGRGCTATDDSMMTLAVARAIMEAAKAKEPDETGRQIDHDRLSELTVQSMQKIGRKYSNRGFGGLFYGWIFSDEPKPYYSFGNGSAMRVSPAGFAARDEWEAEELAMTVTGVTHDHEEGLKGAKATAVAIAMARRGALKSEIRERITSRYYPLDFKIDEIRPTYQFNVTCQGSVPQAIECFLESESFEDTIRTAVSLGGDSDTIAAIAGAIAEAYYGVPEEIKEKALGYLDDELRGIYDDWEKFVPSDGEQFRVLTKYIGKISAADSLGEWIIDSKSQGTLEDPIRFPYVDYNELISSFMGEFYQFFEAHPEYGLNRYSEILEKNGLEWNEQDLRSADVQSFDEQGVLALIMGAIRGERFCDGTMLELLEDGSLTSWLKRLKDIDWQKQDRQVQAIELEHGGFFSGPSTYRLTFHRDGADWSHPHHLSRWAQETKVVSSEAATALGHQFEAIHPEYWAARYDDPTVLDGEQWSLTVGYSDGTSLSFSGSNAYPENWRQLTDFFGIDPEEDDEE